MVQYRPALGIWHRWPVGWPFLRPGGAGRRGRRPAIGVRLRAAAAPCLLHPVDRRQPGAAGRYHGPLVTRGQTVQIWLRDRIEFLAPAGQRSEEHTSELQSLMRLSY